MVKAVLFDMDGVLVDSLDAWFKLFNMSLKHFGKKEFTWNHFMDNVWGGPIERDAQEFFGKPVEEVIDFYYDNFDFFKKNLRLFPHTKETLKELKDMGLKLGLVTNTPGKQAHKLLDYLRLKKYFDVIVGGDEVKNGKPAPDIVFEACKRLNLDVKDAVLVGDTEMDMLSGKDAGCVSIGFRIQGDKRIDDLNELIKFLNK